MKIKTFFLIFLSFAAFKLSAQQLLNYNSKNLGTGESVQRHVSSDAILQITNRNYENKPIDIQHNGEVESANLSNELSRELKRLKQTVISVAASDTLKYPYGGGYNFTYKNTDSIFYITVYPYSMSQEGRKCTKSID